MSGAGLLSKSTGTKDEKYVPDYTIRRNHTDHPNPNAGLIEAYYPPGDLEETAICCRKVLDLAPGNARARQILTAIE